MIYLADLRHHSVDAHRIWIHLCFVIYSVDLQWGHLQTTESAICVFLCVYVWNRASAVRVGVDRGAPFRPQHCVQSLRSACGVPKPSHKTPVKEEHSRHSENCFSFWPPPAQHIRLSQYKNNIVRYGTMDPGWVSEPMKKQEKFYVVWCTTSKIHVRVLTGAFYFFLIGHITWKFWKLLIFFNEEILMFYPCPRLSI